MTDVDANDPNTNGSAELGGSNFTQSLTAETWEGLRVGILGYPALTVPSGYAEDGRPQRKIYADGKE